MNYIFLTEKFYLEYDEKNFPEIERKSTRPYIMIKISIGDSDFGIPLRSGISHPNALWTNKKQKCGADYSKAVIIPDESYIDDKTPYIRSDEHKALRGKEFQLKQGFEKYLEEYKNALKNQHIERNKYLCKCSTLQYWHKELEIK